MSTSEHISWQLNNCRKREYFKQIGADVKLYKGVTSWFSKMNEYAEKKGIELEHYITSSGLKEIIEGSKIANCFKRIYDSSYLYSTDGIAEWPAQAINYTNTVTLCRLQRASYSWNLIARTFHQIHAVALGKAFPGVTPSFHLLN